jgi:hypothetical protein
MNELDQKKIIIPRIISHLNPAPANAVNELLKQPLKDLEVILERLGTKCEHDQIKQHAQAQIDEMRAASRADGAWAHCLLKARLNGRVLADTEANRALMESLLAPHESPSAAIYETIALSYPQKFSWQTPKPVQTDAERRAEFNRFIREHKLSSCEANFTLFVQGAALENFARASQVEEAAYAQEATRDRQKYLLQAPPSVLKAEAAYEFQTSHDAALREDAERRHQLLLNQQQHYPELPATINGEKIDAAYLRKLSTTSYPLFKQMVRKFGSGRITDRLRNEA